jgi:hypothetical protein
MTSIVRADNISTVAGTGTVTLEAGNTLDTSAGLVTPAGHVIQVVTVSTSTQVQTSSSSDTDTGLTVSITPTSASSKILVLATVMGCYRHTDSASTRLHLRLKRNGSTINDSGGNFAVNSTSIPMRGEISMSQLDSPNSTSAVEYKVYLSSDEGLSYVAVQKDGNSGTSSITVMEIAG